MSDEYATLRAAFHAGATIQAYTLNRAPTADFGGFDEGQIPLDQIADLGYWRDIEGEPRFQCHVSRYRVKPEPQA